jgi:imidazoleglycerol-phosphate dehydratase
LRGKKVAARKAEFTRKTKETEIHVELVMEAEAPIAVQTGVPFFDHLLESMAFHGGFGLTVRGKGDLEVDEHHLVEDTGIVLGEALGVLLERSGPIARFGHAVIPMDEALAEVALDVGGRSCLVYRAEFPQPRVGRFELALLQEFLQALARRGRLTLHTVLRHGGNSHHMAEALFKALGVALSLAYGPASRPAKGMSTKGTTA